jgi:hypothetical protein
MEELLLQAQAKGMHVVDNTRLSDSYGDFEEQITKADSLCEVIDPEETPYLSKYKARDILDALCNKLEANRTIASLEKNKDMFRELNWRIAAVRVRLGSISWEVEEPHHTQVELELAAVRMCITCVNVMHLDEDNSLSPLTPHFTSRRSHIA